MRMTIVRILLIGSATLAGAQDRVAGPVSGYVFDGSARVLRPILGIPGAATLGDALDTGSPLSAAYVSPRLDSALVLNSIGARFFRLNGGTATLVACDGLATPERVAFSPSGTAAALLAARRIIVVSGLPDTPAVAGELNVAALLRPDRSASGRSRLGPGWLIGSFAVADDGQYVLAAAGGEIHLLGVKGENFSVPGGGALSLVAFAPGGHDAGIADVSGAVRLLRDVAGASTQRSLAPVDADAPPPAGVAFAADGRSLFVAAAGAKTVSVFDLDSGNRTDIECACDPTGVFPLGGYLRLTEAGASPLYLLDARGSLPRVVFVPARSE